MKKVLLMLFIAAILLSCASKSGSDVTSSADNVVSVVIESSQVSVSSDASTSDVVSSEGGNTSIEKSISIFNVDWYLTGVFINGTDTQFRRGNQPHVNIELFTLTLGDLANGLGAPNRFTAPYTTSDDGSINVGLIASTLMAALFEPVNLREHDYFTYIHNSYKWQVVNGSLELLSKAENGGDVRLVFSLEK